MIIDSHAHSVAGRGEGPAVAGNSLMARWTVMEASGRAGAKPAPADREELLDGLAFQLELMDQVGTDIQLTSPRPFVLKHSHPSAELVHQWTELNNDSIAVQARQRPDRIYGVAALPQAAGRPITDTFDEIDRILELGFVGVLLNPDPSEGAGTSPLLEDEYWFPLYEKLQKHDLPALLHPAACYGRETYSEHFISEESLAVLSLIRGRIPQQFPGLKIIVPHGGGSIPYQLGRWKAANMKAREAGADIPPFEEALRSLWFDTCLYTQDAIELLVKVVGADRVLFGTERPGSGNPFDDLKPVIEAIPSLSQEDKNAIFEGNARRVYSRLA
ncbi:amidohydrolase family protein [Nocardiopsis sp. ATB16-24]|uniref:amidohydrolase family protein n=1 Tax=Nocardiopsis sp. ATB16-24 TaxID=3019555 RepID=UPI00255461DA|nr:amidohydrolase family protein [Nocardiopsis sp. ATB16-24]